jgi:hypothetical protein
VWKTALDMSIKDSEDSIALSNAPWSPQESIGIKVKNMGLGTICCDKGLDEPTFSMDRAVACFGLVPNDGQQTSSLLYHDVGKSESCQTESTSCQTTKR